MFRVVWICAVLVLTGCSTMFSTDYESSLDATVSKTWRVSSVDVFVPDELTVSEANTFAPEADIVWHGDLPGDRREQVAAIIESGIRTGAAGLNGGTPVRMQAVLVRFHGVTPITLSKAPAAVHNIAFTLQVVDARTGSVLAGPDAIEADLPAKVGISAVLSAQSGRDEKTRIKAHIARTTAGWLGIGPDPRGTFRSIGR